MFGVTAGIEAARILQRRWQSRHTYRRRRDKKIATDLIGHIYLGVVSGHKLTLIGYDPRAHTVQMANYTTGNSSVITTDEFWGLLRRRQLIEC